MAYPISLPLSSETSLATLHHPSPEIWELEMHNGKDNRLTVPFIQNVLIVALDLVEKDWRASTKEPGAPGALIVSGKHDQVKFFSNGRPLLATWNSANVQTSKVRFGLPKYRWRYWFFSSTPTPLYSGYSQITQNLSCSDVFNTWLARYITFPSTFL